MNFGFTEEQALLRDQVARFLRDQCPMAEVRDIADSETGHSPSLWAEMGRLGWLGLAAPTEMGGSGLNWVDQLVLLEEMGRGLIPSPYLSHALCVEAITRCGDEAAQRRLLPTLASGATIGAVSLLDEPDLLEANGVTLTASADADGLRLQGSRRLVPDAAVADLLILAFRSGAGDSGLCIAAIDCRREGISCSNNPTLDKTKRTGTVTFDDVRIEPEDLLVDGDAWPVIETMLDIAAVSVTAESVGAVQAALDLTSDYAKNRIQFGSPIGRFQGVKHRLAEIYVDVESARSLVYFAAWTIDHDPKALQRAASLAKAYASNTFPQIGIDTVGLHGAIGFTAEYDIQLFLKRTKWMRPIYGDADHHYERVAALGGL